MRRENPSYYISPSAISIIPNANNSANDLAVYIQSAARISVYCPKIPELDYDDTSYQEWTLSGRNRRLMQGDGPYTIYARLEKENKKNGYLVFAAQQQVQQGGLLVWKDKYPYVTASGLSDDATEPASDTYWYIKLGTVSDAANNQRSIDLDTGILGTPLYNNEWQMIESKQPLRVTITNDLYSSSQKETGTPFIGWGQQVTLAASLIRGWDMDASSLVDHWVIKRNTGDAVADASWNNDPTHLVVSSEGVVVLKHQKNGQNPVDDFNAAVSAAFTLEAWGVNPSTAAETDSSEDSDSSEEPEIVLLADGTITILAETKETYGLWLSDHAAHYNPSSRETTPVEGISIRVRGTAQNGDVSFLTKEEITDAQLTLYYDEGVDDSSDSSSSDSSSSDSSSSDSSSSDAYGTGLNFNADGVANLPISAFSSKKSLNLRLINAAGKEVANDTVSFVQDGETAVSYRCLWQLSNEEVSTLSCTAAGVLKNVAAYPDNYIKFTLLKREGNGNEKVVTGYGSIYIIAGAYTNIWTITNASMTAQRIIDDSFASEVNSAACKKVTVIFNVTGGPLLTYSIDKVFDGSNADTWTIGTDGFWYRNGVKYTDANHPDGIQAEGKDGTGISLSGTVDVLYSSQAQAGQTSLEGLTGVSVGECYVVNSTRHLYFFDNTSQETGVPAGWRDMGEFKGADGLNSYMHMAWADDIIFEDSSDSSSSDSDSSGENEPIPVSATGFITVYDGKPHSWLGLCTDNNPVDPVDFRAYKWNYIKGSKGEGAWIADLDNEMDIVLTDSVGFVRTLQNVVSEISMYCGNEARSFVIDKVYRDGALIAEHSGDSMEFVTVSWSANPNRPASQILTIEYASGAYFGNPVRDKDIFTISMYASDNPTIMRDLTIVVAWKESVVYQLNPSVDQINIGRGADGSYIPSTYNLTCGYKRRNEDGTITTTTDTTILFGFNWCIYFRLRHRPDAQHQASYWGSKYYRYGYVTYKAYVTSLDVATYDAVEFIICTQAGDVIDLTQSSPSSVQDRETVPVVADGEKGDSPYVASLDTELLMVHTTGNGKPTKNQTLSIAASIRHGEENVSVAILGVKRNGTNMSYQQQAWRATGITITFNAQTKIITISYNTLAKINEKDVFSFSLVHIEDGETLFLDTKVLTVQAYARDEYTLIPSETQIVVDRVGGTYDPATFTLTCGYRKIDVDGQVTNVASVTGRIDSLYNLYFRRHLRQSDIWENTYYLYSMYAEGQDDSSDSSSSDSDSSDEGSHMLTDADVSIYDDVEFILCSNTAHVIAANAVTGLLYKLEVPVLTNGTVGATGPSYYYLGEWRNKADVDNYISAGTRIETTQYERPFVSYTVDGQEPLYYLFISPEYIIAPDPGEGNYRPSPGADLSKWTPMQSQNKFILANAIFADFAKFGSAVINKDWEISANGRIDGVEFSGDQQVTGKTVDADSSTWSTKAYMLFDNRNPKAPSESLLYKKNQDLADYVSSHTRGIGTVDLVAGITYSIRVWGYANYNGTPHVFVKATLSGVGATDVLTVQGGSASFNQMAFFRVSEDGQYVFSIYEKKHTPGPGGDTGYSGAVVEYIQISKVSFAPIYALDLLAGSIIQRDLMTSGFIRKDKTVINQLNISYYRKGVQDNTLVLDKCGSFIEIIDDLSVQFWLPVLCREYRGINNVTLTQAEKDYVRSLVGTKILLYLTEGSLIPGSISRGEIATSSEEPHHVLRHIFIDGQQVSEPTSGSASTDISNTYLCRVTFTKNFVNGQGWYYEYSWYFKTLTSGQFVELECKTDLNEGYEIVYWEENTKGFIS